MKKYIKDDEIWRLYIDRERQYLGKDAFEDEKGYMKGMLEAHKHMLSTLEKKLTPEYIQTLRAIAINQVESLVSNNTAFRDKETGAVYGLTNSASSSEGIKEFIKNQYTDPKYPYNLKECLEKSYLIRGLYPLPKPSSKGDIFKQMSKDTKYEQYKITPEDINGLTTEEQQIYKKAMEGRRDNEKTALQRASAQTIVDYIEARIFLGKIIKDNLLDDLCNDIYDERPTLIADISDNIEARAGEIIEDYYKEKEAANDPDKKLTAIVNLVQRLEQLHPFGDANCRTFCMLLLNRELLNNQMDPAMVKDPNNFDMQSKSELIDLVKEGQEHMKQYQPENEHTHEVTKSFKSQISSMKVQAESDDSEATLRGPGSS
ncbi:hypothetical protein EP47_03840 [Legionella norrlandica]|uniref:Uncharacterized protein n=1 Tax=Legionella norrlandica TaxID=1498499 RepID=A0A0A2STW0_9GAMM|nr:Fic family protein [Legionella norrlandica]KGP64197.1 hypothetical protein EP47_03840 [Legionella norrlandica]